MTVVLLIIIGCEKKNGSARGAPVSAERIATTRDALTRGMRPVPLDKLGPSHRGRQCVIVAYAPAGGYQPTSPPPPPGMVHLLGETIIYNGEFDGVSADTLTVRAAYPTPGNFKRMEIARDDLQSVHVAQ
jgi:hypothetical protein